MKGITQAVSRNRCQYLLVILLDTVVFHYLFRHCYTNQEEY